ncbi:MAG: lysine 2,3-aminomutase [Chloroflexi bacterium]|nr:lysine 2,3-aminomutase [Chloroflexota bacterium]
MIEITQQAAYQPITRTSYGSLPQIQQLDPELREQIEVVSAVFPFRTNAYIVDHLIDWEKVPDDPIYQLTFPQRGMLSDEDFNTIASLIRRGAKAELRATADAIRLRHNPHPAGQLTHNVPHLDGKPIAGLQHKYAETVLFFPSRGQTCHAYCSYCFRWAQFVGMQDLKFAAKEADDLVRYLAAHPEVSDVLFTGGDPMIMKTRALRAYIEPLLSPKLAHVQSIRIGTKSLAYWPQRFVTDDDADDALRLLEQVIRSGRHVAIMAHASHPRELAMPVAQRAIGRLRDIGCEIRMQAPIIRHVNDSARAWAALWKQGVKLGMIPYYMFVSRDTGPKNYFEVPLAESYGIFRKAYSQVSGLARTVRGPVMSATPGKVLINGVAQVGGQRVFVMSFLQGRDPSWVKRPFFAHYDPSATWLFDLKPAFGAPEQFFDPDASYAHTWR